MSPTEFVTTGHVRSGVLRIRNRRQIEQWAKRLRDCELTVTIERAHATRSLDQNALYHVAYVKPLAEYTGYSSTEMHAYLKQRFLPADQRRTKTLLLHNRDGEIIDRYEIDLSTTTRLNRVEFSEYLSEIAVFASELGVTVGSLREDAS